MMYIVQYALPTATVLCKFAVPGSRPPQKRETSFVHGAQISISLKYQISITVQFGAPMVSGNYCVTGLLRILHSTVLYLALKKLSFGWKVLRYTVYLPTLYSALR